MRTVLDQDDALTQAQQPEADRALVAAALAGDRAALETLIRRLQPALLRTARAVVDDARAEEITQDAWINIIRALPRFNWASELKTWAIRITLNQAFSARRREQKESERLTSSSDLFDDRGRWRKSVEPWHCDTPEALLASEQMSAVIQRALSELPRAQRLAVVLRDIEGLDLAEVCNILDVSASNARVLLHRGRSKLREVIDGFQHGAR